MKRLIFIILFTSVFFCGCASFKAPKRYVENNTFYSSWSPKLKIIIDNNFKFIDKSEDPFFKMFTDLGSHILSKVEMYEFLDIFNSKGVLIRIITLPDNKQVCFWTPKFPMLNNSLSLCKIGFSEEICFWPPKFSMLNNSVSSYKINFNEEKYYYHIYEIKHHDNNFLFKSFVRNVNTTDTIQLQIYYFEKVEDYGQKFIPEFSERADKCIQILPIEASNSIVVSPRKNDSRRVLGDFKDFSRQINEIFINEHISQSLNGR